MTNRELITTALRMIGVLDAYSAANAEDANLGLSELNDLMLDLEGQGAAFGYPPQDNLSEDFPLSDLDAASVKPLLAMRLLTFFPSQQVPPALGLRAEEAGRRLLRDGVLSNLEEAQVTNIPLGEAYRGRASILTDE